MTYLRATGNEVSAETSPPDILFFLSDQHSGLYCGYTGRQGVETPNLDGIAARGTVCDTAYTACPLCVPARATMLTGQLTSKNFVFNNTSVLSSDKATFLHSLASAGYETVLCGRMHFKDHDQRHGFTKRIFGDITAPFLGGVVREGLFKTLFGQGGCLDFVGSGTSPVLEYDRAVVAAALDYLAKDHEKPQCIVVGTYGPHYPYVAPPDLLEHYRNRVSVPRSWNPDVRDPNPLVEAKRQRTRTDPITGETSPVTDEIVRSARAAYHGMITEQDRHIGSVHTTWHEYLDRRGRQGVFIYASDHGDTCGEHGLFGKSTFYEGAVRIPLVFEGFGVKPGRHISNPVSIMDIAPTLCELAHAAPPAGLDGQSVAGALSGGTEAPDRPVLSEWVQEFNGEVVAGRMVRTGPWKFMHYRHRDVPDQLFDLENDSDELSDLAGERPGIVRELMRIIESDWQPENISARFAEKRHDRALIGKWIDTCRPDVPETERWRVTQESLQHTDPAI